MNSKVLWTVFLSISFKLAFATDFPAYQSEVLTDQLESPWAVTQLDDNRLIISEKPGHLRLWSEAGLSEPIKNVPDVFFKSQGGMLDVRPHPNFAENSWLYFSYAIGDMSENALRLSRAKLNNGELKELENLVTISPYKDTPVHYGGRIAFIEDGSLLLTSGEGFDYREAAQKTDGLLGKIIRLNADGSIPQDNPFYKNKNKRSEIWSLGHRNPQGLVYDEKRKRVISHEHGPAGGDEVNIIEKGKNYGWPVITNGLDYSGATITPFTEYPDMEQPLFDWTPSIAPSGMTVYYGEMFSELNGDLIVTTLKYKDARWLTFEEDKITEQQRIFSEFDQRLRDITTDSSGAIYLITDSGSLIKISKR